MIPPMIALRGEKKIHFLVRPQRKVEIKAPYQKNSVG